jgi:hypothetical protein
MSQNIYADAINHALGVATPPPVPVAPRGRDPLVKVTRTHTQDVGTVYTEQYKGYSIIVREWGVSSISPDPEGFSYWTIFFFTDDELRIENAGGNVQERAAICRRAIDRHEAGTPVWSGSRWWDRNLRPEEVE